MHSVSVITVCIACQTATGLQDVHELAFTLDTSCFWFMQPEGRELKEEAGAGLVVKCDAVVVGSGAGAGPCTALLAAAGLRVVVLEKGTFTPNHELSLTVLFATFLLFSLDCVLTWIKPKVGSITFMPFIMNIRLSLGLRPRYLPCLEGQLEGWQGAVDITRIT